MINALEYINSDDIRGYWETMHYRPTAQETAWLIWQSRKHNVRQKHDAWGQIIKETEDNEIIKYHPEIDELTTLHDLLKRFMEWEDEAIRVFFDEGRLSCYSVEFCSEDSGWYKPFDASIFTSLGAIFKEVEKGTADDDPAEERIQKIMITKHILDYDKEKSADITLVLDPDRNVISVNPYDCGCVDVPDYIKVAFEFMWFNFPVPFQKGDIVCNKFWDGKYSLYQGPIVLTETTWGYCKGKPDYHGSDTSDMNVWGYFLTDSGNVYGEVTDGLMDFEYCRREFSGYERQFLLLSSFLRGEINEELLLRCGQKIMLEEMAKNLWVNDITDEYLNKAGMFPRKDTRLDPEEYVKEFYKNHKYLMDELTK